MNANKENALVAALFYHVTGLTFLFNVFGNNPMVFFYICIASVYLLYKNFGSFNKKVLCFLIIYYLIIAFKLIFYPRGIDEVLKGIEFARTQFFYGTFAIIVASMRFSLETFFLLFQ